MKTCVKLLPREQEVTGRFKHSSKDYRDTWDLYIAYLRVFAQVKFRIC